MTKQHEQPLIWPEFVRGETFKGINKTIFSDADPDEWHQHINPNKSIGGWVQNTATISPTAFVGPRAVVFGNAKILDHARVEGRAWVFGNAILRDRSRAIEDSQVFGDSEVSGNAEVKGEGRVFGRAKVYGRALIMGHVFDDARVGGDTLLRPNVQVFGSVCLELKASENSGAHCIRASIGFQPQTGKWSR